MNLVSLRTLAKQLDTEPAEIIQWADGGLFPRPLSLPNGEPRWRQTDIDAWIKSLAGTPPKMTESAIEVLKALLGATTWISANELTVRMGTAAKPNSGSIRRPITILRDAGYIVSERYGYAITERGKDYLASIGLWTPPDTQEGN